jgi:hypothetical protein
MVFRLQADRELDSLVTQIRASVDEFSGAASIRERALKFSRGFDGVG